MVWSALSGWCLADDHMIAPGPGQAQWLVWQLSNWLVGEQIEWDWDREETRAIYICIASFCSRCYRPTLRNCLSHRYAKAWKPSDSKASQLPGPSLDWTNWTKGGGYGGVFRQRPRAYRLHKFLSFFIGLLLSPTPKTSNGINRVINIYRYIYTTLLTLHNLNFIQLKVHISTVIRVDSIKGLIVSRIG